MLLHAAAGQRVCGCFCVCATGNRCRLGKMQSCGCRPPSFTWKCELPLKRLEPIGRRHALPRKIQCQWFM